MLKSKKTKIIIGALILLCVLVASSIWVMSSMKSNSVEDFDYSLLAESASLASSNTQIDNIIKNSLSADTDESEDYDTSKYYIYVITPDGKTVPDAIKAFITNASDGFKDVIINENRTIDEFMGDNKIQLEVRTIAQLNAMGKTALATEIGKADLIYMYKAAEGDYESGSSLMSDDLYEVLTNFITDKPMIIDYELTNSGSSDDNPDVPPPSGDNTSTKTYILTTQDFKNSWKRTQTVNVSTWTDLANPDDTFKEYFSSIWYNRYSLSKVPDGYDTWNDYWMRNAQDNGSGPVSTLNMLYIYGDTAPTPADITELESWLNTDEGKKRLFARNSAVSDMPEQIKITYMQADLVSNNILYYGTVQLYDYILIAPDTYTSHDISASESNNVYASLKALSTSTASGVTYILFGTLPTGSGSGSGSSGGSTPPTENLKFNTDTNYGRLLDMVITTTGYSKNSSVLVVGLDFMDTLAARPNNNPTKVSKIVTLINKNRFRTNSGSGSGGISGKTSTTAFRVLELQPCYPIDLDVAYDNPISTTLYHSGKYSRHGNYYTVPGNVVNGVSEDEVGAGIEYYQWDLSVAKLSYALGIPAENIELVQMSTSEFITSKADVTTAYDLIYIGGNKSAIKPSSWFGIVKDSTYALSSYMTYPSMYFHNGDYTELGTQLSGYQGANRIYSSKDYQYTRVNGNDITYDRLQQLMEYVDSGLPIVVGSELWDRYDEAENLQNSRESAFLDVESNMYTLLKYLDQKKTDGKDNVLLGWENKVSRAEALTRWKAGISDDSNKNAYLSEYYVEVRQSQVNAGQTFTTRKIDNSQGVYGDSATVTIWNDTLNSELASVALRDGYLRPKYEVTTNAVGYTSNDENSLLKTKDLESGKYLYWTIDLVNVDAAQLTPGRYYAVLLKDNNDNAEFDLATEQVTSIDLSQNNKLTYTIDSTFWGAVSWQIVVVDTLYTDGKITEQALSTSTADITCIARENKPKKSATILEIMPLTLADNGTYNSGRKDSDGFNKSSGGLYQDGHSLYLDINYQQASGSDFLYSSLDDTGYYKSDKKITDGITYKYSGSVGGGGYAFTTYAGEFYTYSMVGTGQYVRQDASTGVQLGLYQPHLGLNQFDTANNREDWGYNYVDEIADDYDLTLDIMYLDDIEYYSYMAATLTDADRTEYKENAAAARNEYMKYMQQNYGKTYTNVGNDIDPYVDLTNKETTLKGLIDDFSKRSGLSATDKYVLETARDSGDYFKIFYTNCIGGNLNSSDPGIVAIKVAYEEYRVLNDAKITAYREWRHYSMLSYGPEEFLRRNYDVICFGFLDDLKNGYDYSDNACKAFQAFVNPPTLAGVPDEEQLKPGSVLLTHDSLSKFDENNFSLNFTEAMREIVGMDRFHFTEDSSVTGTFVTKLNPELSAEERENRGLTDDTVYQNYMANRYYVSSIATDYNFGKTNPYNAASWKNQSDAFVNTVRSEAGNFLSIISADSIGTGKVKIGYSGLTNGAIICRTNAVLGQTYMYEESEVTKQMSWNVDPAKPLSLTGTTKATQVNRGIVTTYPYYIKPDLKISPTHCQTFALDLEDDSVTAWYTLAGDNSMEANGKIVSLANYTGTISYDNIKQNSSIYAASPKDGVNNYYIYSKGNVTYCGAGHAAITGPSRNNNDERRLFINVLVNLVNKSTYTEPVSNPDIALYDPDGTLAPNGTVVKQDITGEYYIDVTSINSYPEFGFSMIDLEPGQQVTDIQIYYDLDYVKPASGASPDNDYHENDSHVLIPIPGNKSDLIDYLNTKENGKNSIYQITSINWPGMVTQKSYFEKYDNKYTYIVIKVTLSGQTEPVYKRIRINLKEQLLDLT
ncbi:MAG: DUF5057 domain-containing protein [Lachnospiraceae bacterium]|nr:DUF5057 domain-containing protein [Lachnospiraceae bacterium]